MLRQRLVLVALVVIVFSMIAQVSLNEPSRKVGFGELTKDTERDILEIADRRRADGERH